MFEIDFSDPEEPYARILEAVFRSYIEDGSIEVGDKSPEQILNEYKLITQELVAGAAEFHNAADHRSDLLERAEAEVESGSVEVGVTLYALWIEHTVNGDLIYALQRKGYGEETIKPLIRELRLETKITSLWHIAGFDPIASEDVALVRKISEARNSFVHYKWSAKGEEEYELSKEQLASVCDRARRLEPVFTSREDALFWNDRKDEILNFYREDLKRWAQEVGPFVVGRAAPENSAEEPLCT
jgi:hypothetical protein